MNKVVLNGQWVVCRQGTEPLGSNKENLFPEPLQGATNQRYGPIKSLHLSDLKVDDVTGIVYYEAPNGKFAFSIDGLGSGFISGLDPVDPAKYLRATRMQGGGGEAEANIDSANTGTGDAIWIQSGAESGDGMYLEIDKMNTKILGINGLDVSTVDGALEAIDAVGPLLTISGGLFCGCRNIFCFGQQNKDKGNQRAGRQARDQSTSGVGGIAGYGFVRKEAAMEKIIRVKGKGKIAVKPDRIRLLLNLVGEKSTYEETMERSSAETAQLRRLFQTLGFKGDDLKTLAFHVDTKYESYQSEDKSWKQRFVGYEFHHNLKIEFDADNEILGRVLYALANGAPQPEFRIVYTIKDVEAAKNLLLGRAVEDSKCKAKVLAEAAGVTLGEIQLIDYSWGELEFTNSPMPRMLAAKACDSSNASYAIDVAPDDIEVSDTVTVVWEIA